RPLRARARDAPDAGAPSARADCSRIVLPYVQVATIVTQPRLHRRSPKLRAVARASEQWVLLTYRLPREPSTPRAALWRKLRRLGAAQVLDGLAALPLDARNREHIEWLADEILDAGGEATIWVGELGSAGQERELASRMAE